MELQDLHSDPIQQIRLWLEDARIRSGLDFPEAIALATSTAAGTPSVRMVLLKKINDNSLVFFTNYESRKGMELIANPRAALCLYWEKLGRQIRAEGRIEIAPAEESDEYFQSRPKGSQLGAWASPQSKEIPSRSVLEQKVKENELRFGGSQKIPRPENWGGFRLVPERIEFWSNGENRLHDRIEYNYAGTWSARRLAP